jgi:hypothetical protein
MAEGLPEAVVRVAWRRQGGRCASCGRWLIWERRGRDGGTGAWQPHCRIPRDRGGEASSGNCVVLCSGTGNCHFKVGHGGVEWSHYAAVEDSDLPFLFERSIMPAGARRALRPKRSLLREVLGMRQARKSNGRPGRGVADSDLLE